MARYEKTADGGYLLHHDNGLVEIFDAAGNSMGYYYEGAAPVADPAQVPAGNALVTDDYGTPVKDVNGQYLAAPPPQGVPTASYDISGPTPTGGIQNGLVPSFTPTGEIAAPAGGGSGQYTTNAYDYGAGGYNGGYARGYSRGGYGGGYSGGGYNSYTSSSYQSGGYGNMPAYANGQMHPAFGGQPLQPGGYYRGPQGDDGYDNRQQVRVPGGATAGPFETSAAPGPSSAQNIYGGGSPWNSEGRRGGGGGHSGYGANSAIGQKLKSKVQGMAAKFQYGNSGGGSSSGYTSDKAYARQQHRANKDYRQQQRAYEDGSYLYDGYKMRGFSKKMDPQQAEAFYYHPELLIPKAVKGISKSSPYYDTLEALPANQLSTMAFGARGKAKDGPSQYVNNLAKFYRQAGDYDLPDYDKLVRNLGHAKSKSALGQQFKQPLGFAADSYLNMVNALGSVYQGSNESADARAKLASRYAADYAGKFARKKPGKGQSVNKYVGRRMQDEW